MDNNGNDTSKDTDVLKDVTQWKYLFFYQKAARSGKQNIVEGSEDGMTSSEMEIKLINVARSSLQELCED